MMLTARDSAPRHFSTHRARDKRSPLRSCAAVNENLAGGAAPGHVERVREHFEPDGSVEHRHLRVW